MKKLLTFALALLVTASITACNTGNVTNNNPQDEVVENDNGQKEATIALKGFMNGLKNFDIVELSKFSTVNLIDKAGYENLKDEINAVYTDKLGDSVAKELIDELKEFVDVYVDGLSDSNGYTINEVEYKDGKWVFDVSFEYMNHSSFGDILLEETESLIEEYGIKYVADIQAAVNDPDAEFDLMVQIYSEILEELKDVINDSCAKADKGRVDGTLVVTKKGSKWLVDGTGEDVDLYMDAVGEDEEAE